MHPRYDIRAVAAGIKALRVRGVAVRVNLVTCLHASPSCAVRIWMCIPWAHLCCCLHGLQRTLGHHSSKSHALACIAMCAVGVRMCFPGMALLPSDPNHSLADITSSWSSSWSSSSSSWIHKYASAHTRRHQKRKEKTRLYLPGSDSDCQH